MEERDFELPVATLRPRRLVGRIAAARGAIGRWLREKLRTAFQGRHAPLLLTGVFFSGMMLAMGYIADRAQRAADAIDEAHRRAAEANAVVDSQGPWRAPPSQDPWIAAETQPPGAHALFYIVYSSR